MMEFKELEIKSETNKIKSFFLSPHAKKTMLYIFIGALLGLLYFYLTEGIHAEHIEIGNVFKSLFFGAFLGFFLTNSPCARNKC